MRDHIKGRRICIKAGEHKLFYDIDADEAVYWLRPRLDNKLQRYRVKDAKLAERIRVIAKEHDDDTG